MRYAIGFGEFEPNSKVNIYRDLTFEAHLLTTKAMRSCSCIGVVLRARRRQEAARTRDQCTLSMLFQKHGEWPMLRVSNTDPGLLWRSHTNLRQPCLHYDYCRCFLGDTYTCTDLGHPNVFAIPRSTYHSPASPRTIVAPSFRSNWTLTVYTLSFLSESYATTLDKIMQRRMCRRRSRLLAGKP